MSTITLRDYSEAFSEYRSYAVSHGAVDVIQCGTIKNPGLSDIDTILVIKNWRSFPFELKIFNPERVSPLFTHGPFVVPENELKDLFRFTTLRPFKDEVQIEKEEDEELEKVIVAARQSLSWSHLLSVAERNLRDINRQSMLILKSISYSLKEMLLFIGDQNDLSLSVESYCTELDVLRDGFNRGNEVSDDRIRDLCLESVRLLKLLGTEMGNWIAEQTSIDKESHDAIFIYSGLLLSESQGFFFFDQTKEKCSQQMRAFFQSVVYGYSKSGAGWKGAEFPFHAHYLHTLGWRIWPRRFIKRLVNPALGLRVGNG